SANSRHILTADEWTLLTKRLDEFAVMLKDIDMPMSYHPHIATVIESESDIDRMLEECPNLDLLFDGGHLAYAGADPLNIWRKYEAKINHIHLKDVRLKEIEDVRANNKSFLEGVLAGTFTVPGDGDIDYDAIMKKIQESDYQGWLVVEAEQNPDVAPADVYAEKALDYIKQQIG
ncbi:MAG: TIM barrel protein, partial [Candidatus Portiera sp.]|nr:TIM barrel protein [Portiera sp.]